MALTPKKISFAEAKKAGKSNKDAALAAGYSVKTAGPAGSRLAKDDDVVRLLKKKPASDVGYAPDGVKTPDAPKNWPFGIEQPAEPEPPKKLTAREFLSQVVNDLEMDEKLRLDAAKKLIEFEESKPGAAGKKEQRQKDAEKVAGRFSAGAPPRLVAACGRKV